MQPEQKGEYENSLLLDLEVEWDLPLLFIHALIGQPAKKHLVGRIIRIHRYADTSRDPEQVPVDADWLVQSAGDASRACLGDNAYRLIAWQGCGNDDEFVPPEAGG